MRCFSRFCLFLWASNLWLPVGRLSCPCARPVDVGLTEEADEVREALVLVPEAFELVVDLVTEEDLVAEADGLDDEVFVAVPVTETLVEVCLEVPVLRALVDALVVVADARVLLDRAGLLEVAVL